MDEVAVVNETGAMDKFQASAAEVWKDIDKIRQLFAPKLTDDEFGFFVSLGMGLGANPFTREIWAVKYDETKPASIFCGRDFYRKKAQELSEYDGHYADTVYSNDKFHVTNGEPEHTYDLTDRGDLIGAYCIVRRKTTSQAFYTFVLLSEYDKKQSLWSKMPDTMIRKVAEAQGLRGCFQGTFAGTYDESEAWTKKDNTSGHKPHVDEPKKKEGAEPRLMSEKQNKLIHKMFGEKGEGVKAEILTRYEIESVSELTMEQASSVISELMA